MGNIAANNSKQVLTVASSKFLSDPPTCVFGGLVLSVFGCFFLVGVARFLVFEIFLWVACFLFVVGLRFGLSISPVAVRAYR